MNMPVVSEEAVSRFGTSVRGAEKNYSWIQECTLWRETVADSHRRTMIFKMEANGMEMTGIMQQRSQVGRVERKIVDTDFRISGELPLGTTVRISTLQIYLDVGELYVQVIYAVCMYVDNIRLERNARISHGLLGTKSEWETMTMTNEKKEERTERIRV